MKPGILIPLLLALATVPALTQAADSPFFGKAVQVAQLSPEERRAMRDRWEHASQAERDQMRQIFQDRMRQPIPDYRDYRRDDRQQPGRPPSYEPGFDRWDDGSYGTGFERRRQEDPRSDRRRR